MNIKTIISETGKIRYIESIVKNPDGIGGKSRSC